LIDDFRIYLWQRGIVEAVDHHIPTHRLRNGRLNQTAYSLFLFIRDVAGSDLVGWIDARLRLMSPVHQTGSHVFDKPCWRLWDRYSVSQIRS
jgi:hypothetical protein